MNICGIIKDDLSSRRRWLLWHTVTIAAIAAMLWCFTSQTGTRSSIAIDAIISISEGVLVMVPTWLLERRCRLRVLSLLPCIVIAVFLWANVLYFRYWHDLIPFSSIISAKSYNALVFGSIATLARASDIVYLIAPALSVACFLMLKVKRSATPTMAATLASVLVSLIVYAGGFMAVTLSLRNYARANGRPMCTMQEALAKRFGKRAMRADHWHSNGLTPYIINQIRELGYTQSIELSDTELSAINDYYKRMGAYRRQSEVILQDNSDKNLILIIVESLNAYVINKKYGDRELTPTLNDIISRPGIVSCLNVTPQVRDGGSSDGQLIYNTGLLPLLHGSAATSFGSNAYPSLASTLHFSRAIEVIGEPAYVWNHRSTSSAYGYDAIYDIDDITKAGIDPSATGYDAAIFDMAGRQIASLPQPFMAEITTLSMHFPFNDSGVKRVGWIDSLTDVESIERDYMQMVHYFDAQLGIFLKRLSRSGLSDNTVVVLASDHDQVTSADRPLVNNHDTLPIAFIATNTGITANISRAVGQIDIYPTIVQIMAGDGKALRHALGVSILNEANKSSVDRYGRLHGRSSSELDSLKAAAWQISDLLIRSDYFAKP